MTNQQNVVCWWLVHKADDNLALLMMNCWCFQWWMPATEVCTCSRVCGEEADQHRRQLDRDVRKPWTPLVSWLQRGCSWWSLAPAAVVLSKVTRVRTTMPRANMRFKLRKGMRFDITWSDQYRLIFQAILVLDAKTNIFTIFRAWPKACEFGDWPFWGFWGFWEFWGFWWFWWLWLRSRHWQRCRFTMATTWFRTQNVTYWLRTLDPPL